MGTDSYTEEVPRPEVGTIAGLEDNTPETEGIAVVHKGCILAEDKAG